MAWLDQFLTPQTVRVYHIRILPQQVELAIRDAMSIIKPPALHSGDRVALVSVSSPVPSSDHVDNMVKFLKKQGLAVTVDAGVLSNFGFLAGTDAERLAGLNRALEDERIRAVFFAWGGKGANHLLPGINYEALRRDPKILMGLSDPTCVLNAVTRLANIVTFHGPTGVNFSAPTGLDPFTEASFTQAIFGDTDGYSVPRHSGWQVLKSGTAAGRLAGGHLGTVQTLLGTRYEPDWDGAIMCWEEVGRPARSIDLSLWHFRLRGVFDSIAGMVVGHPLDCNDPEYDAELDLPAMILNATEGYDFPILYNVDFGHADPKVTLPLGVRAELALGDDQTLTLLESAVA